MERRWSQLAGYAVLGLLFLPQVYEQLPWRILNLRQVLQIGCVMLAAYVALVCWFAARLKLRFYLVIALCWLPFALSVIHYLVFGFGEIHTTYLGCMLQQTAYPILLGLFLPSVLSVRAIIRAVCYVLIGQGLLIGALTLLTLARGRLPLFNPISMNPVTDANALVLGVVALVALLFMSRPTRPVTFGRKWRRRAAWAVVVLLALLTVPTFSRGTILGMLVAFAIFAVVRYWGKGWGVHAARLVLLGSLAMPMVVWSGLIEPTQFESVGKIIPQKRAAEQSFGSTLVRRAHLWQAFTSRITWTDIVGTRPELHEYDYYHEQRIKGSVETPHNYWISTMLTAGYGALIATFVLWEYALRLIRRSRDAAPAWLLAWLAFIAVQGIAGRGAHYGVVALTFWCILSIGVAAVPPTATLTLWPRRPTAQSARLPSGMVPSR